jgi:hypothetical protein
MSTRAPRKNPHLHDLARLTGAYRTNYNAATPWLWRKRASSLRRSSRGFRLAQRDRAAPDPTYLHRHLRRSPPDAPGRRRAGPQLGSGLTYYEESFIDGAGQEAREE